MGWFSRRAETRSASWSISDPALASWFGVSGTNYSGVSVGEYSAMGVPAVFRAVSLTAQTIGSLPLKSYRDLPDGTSERVKSFLDDPGGFEGQTQTEWIETLVTHLLLWGNAYALHQYGGAGQLLGLTLVHPTCVAVECNAEVPGGKLYRISLADGTTRELTGVDITHIPALTTDPYGRGLAPLEVARNAFGTTIASQQAAARQFGNGALIAGLVTPEDDLTEEEAKAIKEGLDRKLGGHENANSWAVVNRRLKFDPWQQNNAEAQFLESRTFQVDEVARIFGVPKQLLMQDGASTWGAGIAELIAAWVRFSLAGWTTRIEQRLSRLLPSPRYVRFDFHNLLRPTPADEIQLVIQEVNNGLLTTNEGRALLELPPVPGGDTLRLPPGSPPQAQPSDSEMESA